MIKQKNFSSLFFNTCFDKNQLKNLIAWILDSYGEKNTVDFLETLKQVGFHEATQAGVSLGLEDLQIPLQKSGLIAYSLLETKSVNSKSFAGNMTGVEKSQQMIDIWNQMSETLRQNAVQNFRNTNPVNPIFMMAFSGARGNISQVRQLVAMRGLMADPQGAILEFPIQSNFREGLTITEYLISCYGARKGLVDTALRTATSGYLTRRLVDAVQHIVVTIADCKTTKGVFVKKKLESRLIGRVLGENLFLEKNQVIQKNKIISPKLAKLIASKYTKVLVRSPLTCEAHKAICQLCYGGDLILVNIGEAVGVIAAQSIGEPGTQLTMRTFHTGGVGVFSDQATKPIFSPFDGTVEFPEELIGHFVRTPHGNILYMLKYLPVNPTRPVLKIKSIDSSQNTFVVQEQELPAGSLLLIRQNESVKAGQLVAQASQIKTSKQEMPESTHPIKSRIDGEIFFESMLIWTQKNLPLKTKKQPLKENSIFPDIRTLGQLGNFWVFASCNQRESYFLNPFLQTGDLVSPESFLFNYTFKILQKTQLRRINNKLVLGQPWNQMPLTRVRFHKFGYSLKLSSSFYNLPVTNPNMSSQTIFYLKNSPIFDKKQILIWFPDTRSSSGTVLKSFKKKNSIYLKNKNGLQSSYFSKLKNYSLKQYFSFQDFTKPDSSLDLLARTNKFVNNYHFLNLENNNVICDNYAKLSVTQVLLKEYLNEIGIENNTSFYFFYKQNLFNTQVTVFLTKKYNIKRNFQFENLQTESHSRKIQKFSFLGKTLTKSKSLIFSKIKNTNQAVLSFDTNWVYIPSQPSILNKNYLANQSQIVFLEQGKKFDNFVFENVSITCKHLPGNSLKFFPSENKQTLLKTKAHLICKDFFYSKTELLNYNSIQLEKKLILKNKIKTKLYWAQCQKHKSNVNLKLFSSDPQILKKTLQLKNCPSLQLNDQHPKNCSVIKINFEKSLSYFVFYARNKNFLFTDKNNTQARILAQVKIPQKNLIPQNFIILQKPKQQSFSNQTDLKNYWTKLQYKNQTFQVKSPLHSKQALTSFSKKKHIKAKFQPLSLSSSGWSVNQQTFCVNIILESNSKFPHVRTNLKFTSDERRIKSPMNFFSLFFYDFLSFETKQKFQFKTFSSSWVLPDKPITEGFIKLKTTGEFRRFQKYQNESISSILKLSDLRTLKISSFKNTLAKSQTSNFDDQEKQFKKLKIGQIIRWGQEIAPEVASSSNGRIITLKQNVVVIRVGIPFLASSRGILHVNHKDLIQKDNLLVTLKSRRLQTEDIVQGIPKIEQLFEARETQGGEILTNNVHVLLQNYFVESLKLYSLNIAVSKSVNQIQRFLIDNILEAYLNQGVKISEKHVEIVVKQMTTKVRILNGGYTGLVQGEIVQLTWIQELNKKLQDLDLEQATYEPLVLGISKSVLQSESFLLAASFQEVSRVLVRSALSRKTDFLRGLHENVILGQLIPAGTGLLFENTEQISVNSSITSKIKE
jgi:hypothetical protein